MKDNITTGINVLEPVLNNKKYKSKTVEVRFDLWAQREEERGTLPFMCWFYQVCDISCRKRRWKCNDTLPWRQCDDLPRIVFLLYFCRDQRKTTFSNISAGGAATLLAVDERLLSPFNNTPSMLKKKNKNKLGVRCTKDTTLIPLSMGSVRSRPLGA